MILGDLIYDGEYIGASDPSVLLLRINGVTSYSKDVKRGYAFVCIEGLVTDGARYVSESASRGACVVICSRVPPFCSLPYIRVKNPRRALSFMLYRFYGKTIDKMNVYAVTGTNGKTSTSVYLRDILTESGLKTGYIGSIGTYLDREKFAVAKEHLGRMDTMTTPDPEQFYSITYDMYKKGADCLVVEASSHALKLDKLAPVKVKAGVFTNFSSEHLDFHQDMTDYLMSKCRLYDLSERMCLNSDDKVCVSCGNISAVPVSRYAIYDETADMRACDITFLGLDGISYKATTKDNCVNIRCRTPGMFSVYNSLAATSVAVGEGIDWDVISASIEKTNCIDGRLEVIARGEEHGFYVIIDYAHTEQALQNLLLTVRNISQPHQRIVTLFGCGGDRDKSKRAPMGRVASLYSDLVIVTEDNSRTEDPETIIHDILGGIDKSKRYKVIKDRKKAIEFAINNAQYDDIILLVGKGHEDYEIKADGIVPFSEKEIVCSLLGVNTEEEV